ncbi:hypothetical protein PP175_14525 [Aneurinibacillus sp. Ricciae_BoGa-3]|uniref:hypothetical protein n=1 Tax=Aneurinibacillus sp. Ricciae_BoGa-3 TaxID=3022697 RepID=UPI00233FFAD5|nr:hypothetical protein [Aneurinibacillus sp. Ricciae_BoGa-3]WCK52646.1 hypothetical protein PP175_14525 [Aneurinibacillus sp. Ricciae_BoGa-3]
MKKNEILQTCQTNIYKFVRVRMADGKVHKGYIVNVDNDHVTLAVPGSAADWQAYAQGQRWFPFGWLALPLAFLAGVAVARPRYPYPPYYPAYPPYYPAYPSYYSPYPGYRAY